VNTDIIPDADGTRNIGSSSKRWKNGYFSGDVVVDGYVWGAHRNIVRVADNANITFNSPTTIIQATITTHGKPVLILTTFNLWCDTANSYVYISIQRDGNELAYWKFAVSSDGWNDKPVTLHWVDYPDAGEHTYEVKITYVSRGTWDTRGVKRVLTLIELQ